MKKLLLGSAMAVMFVMPAMPSMAQETVALPAGHTALNISATEKQEVEQDLLIASLRIQHEAKTSNEVQKYINDHMKRAMAEIKKMTSVKVETGNYYVRPDYRYITTNKENGDRERVLEKWNGSQTVTIKGKTSEDVLKLAGELQDMHFVMNGLNYQLSPQKYDEVRDGLMEKTVGALMDRAKRVAKALGKTEVDLVEINVDANQGYAPQPVYARAAKMELMSADSAAMPAPTAEAGETTVTMSVNARAIIKP